MARTDQPLKDLLMQMAANNMDFVEIPVDKFTVSICINRTDRQDGLRAAVERYMKEGR